MSRLRPVAYRPKDLELLARSAREFNELTRGGRVVADMHGFMRRNEKTIKQLGELMSGRQAMMNMAWELERPMRAVAQLRQQHLAVVDDAHRILTQHRETIRAMERLVPQVMSAYPSIIERASEAGEGSLEDVVATETGVDLLGPLISDEDALVVAEAAEEIAQSLSSEISDLREAVDGLSDTIRNLPSAADRRGSALATLTLLVAVLGLLPNQDEIAEVVLADLIWLANALYLVAAYAIRSVS